VHDLVGPHKEDEVLEGKRLKPSDVYLTGILWPLGDRMDGGDDDGSNGDSEDDDSPSAPGLVGQQRPCTMGVSFAADAGGSTAALSVRVEFATYVHEEVEAGSRWTRKSFVHAIERLELPGEGNLPPIPPVY
jgi:hypothetical protein